MSVLTRYLVRQLLFSTLLCLFILASLELFLSMIGELGDLGHGQYGVPQVAVYCLLMLCSNVYIMYPMMALIAVILAFGRLAHHNELMAMRASSCSAFYMLKVIVISACIIVPTVTVLGEGVGVALSRQARSYKTLLLFHHTENYRIGSHYWTRNNHSIVYINKMTPHQLSDFNRFNLSPDGQLKSYEYAPVVRKDNDHWQARTLNQLYLSPKQTHQVKRVNQGVLVDLSFVDARATDVGFFDLGLWNLWQVIHDREQSGLNNEDLEYGFMHRCFQPFITMLMMCLALPFVYLARMRHSRAGTILGGVLFSFVFYTLTQLLGLFSLIYTIPAWLASGFPVVLMLMFLAVSLCLVNYRLKS